MSLSNVIDVVATGAQPHPSERQLRELFATCGRIASVYPWRGISSDKLHHFIVFDSEASAVRALAEFRHMFHISTLQTDQILRDRYCRTIAVPQRELPPTGPSNRYNHRKSGSHQSQSYHTPHRNPNTGSVPRSTPAQNRQRGYMHQSLPPSSSSSHPQEKSTLPPLRWTDAPNEGSHFAPAVQDPPSINTYPSRSRRFSDSSISVSSSRNSGFPESSSSQFTTPLTPNPKTLDSIFRTSSRAEHVIDLTVDGRSTPFDLERDLPPKAEDAVRILRRNTNFGAWMMVAIQYRRKGDLRSAEQVIAEFIDWMVERGDEYELKPALLFLSRLHADEAKAAASGLTATEALRDSTVLNHQKTAAHYISIAHGMTGSIFTSLKRFVAHHDKDVEKENIDPKSLPPSPQERPSSDRHGWSGARNPTSTGQVELATLRLAKRRFEDEFTEQRAVRQKLERSLQETKTELTRANEMTKFLQAQIKQEVDARRQATLDIQEAKELIKVKEEEARQTAARKTMLEIASQLTKKAVTMYPVPDEHTS